jgi:hypothetical protein
MRKTLSYYYFLDVLSDVQEKEKKEEKKRRRGLNKMTTLKRILIYSVLFYSVLFAGLFGILGCRTTKPVELHKKYDFEGVYFPAQTKIEINGTQIVPDKPEERVWVLSDWTLSYIIYNQQTAK